MSSYVWVSEQSDFAGVSYTTGIFFDSQKGSSH